MRNVTITLDEEVARWARIRAAECDTSVSRLVGDMLRKKMMEDKSYIVAMEHYLSKIPKALKKTGLRYPSRQELHGR